MGFFTNHKKKSDKDLDIVTLASGTMICPDQIKDAVFSQQMMGQTIGFILDSGEIVSPVTGKVEVMFPTGHAFMIRMKDGTGILVHVGINTVELNGKGFKVYGCEGWSDSCQTGSESSKATGIRYNDYVNCERAY